MFLIYLLNTYMLNNSEVIIKVVAIDAYEFGFYVQGFHKQNLTTQAVYLTSLEAKCKIVSMTNPDSTSKTETNDSKFEEKDIKFEVKAMIAQQCSNMLRQPTLDKSPIFVRG